MTITSLRPFILQVKSGVRSILTGMIIMMMVMTGDDTC